MTSGTVLIFRYICVISLLFTYCTKYKQCQIKCNGGGYVIETLFLPSKYSKFLHTYQRKALHNHMDK
jgi:hypothetical protein